MVALQSHDTTSRSTTSDFGGQLIAQHVGAETAIMWHVHGTLLHRSTCTTVVPTVRVSNTHEAAPLAALHIHLLRFSRSDSTFTTTLVGTTYQLSKLQHDPI